MPSGTGLLKNNARLLAGYLGSFVGFALRSVGFALDSFCSRRTLLRQSHNSGVDDLVDIPMGTMLRGGWKIW